MEKRKFTINGVTWTVGIEDNNFKYIEKEYMQHYIMGIDPYDGLTDEPISIMSIFDLELVKDEDSDNKKIVDIFKQLKDDIIDTDNLGVEDKSFIDWCGIFNQKLIAERAKQLEKEIMSYKTQSEREEDSKLYYTPKIEEFCMGFEFEFLSNKNYGYFDESRGSWVEKVFTGGNMSGEGTEVDAIQDEDNEVRVKFLDKLDVESLGFEYKGLTDEGLPEFRLFYEPMMWSSKVCTAVFNKDNNTVNINIQSTMFYSEEKESMTFNVKNKSELKRILKSLNII